MANGWPKKNVWKKIALGEGFSQKNSEGKSILTAIVLGYIIISPFCCIYCAHARYVSLCICAHVYGENLEKFLKRAR